MNFVVRRTYKQRDNKMGPLHGVKTVEQGAKSSTEDESRNIFMYTKQHFVLRADDDSTTVGLYLYLTYKVEFAPHAFLVEIREK